MGRRAYWGFIWGFCFVLLLPSQIILYLLYKGFRMISPPPQVKWPGLCVQSSQPPYRFPLCLLTCWKYLKSPIIPMYIPGVRVQCSPYPRQGHGSSLWPRSRWSDLWQACRSSILFFLSLEVLTVLWASADARRSKQGWPTCDWMSTIPKLLPIADSLTLPESL